MSSKCSSKIRGFVDKKSYHLALPRGARRDLQLDNRLSFSAASEHPSLLGTRAKDCFRLRCLRPLAHIPASFDLGGYRQVFTTRRAKDFPVRDKWPMVKSGPNHTGLTSGGHVLNAQTTYIPDRIDLGTLEVRQRFLRARQAKGLTRMGP